MNDLSCCCDCCSSVTCCDCCSDCCSIDCCPDCCGAGGLFGGIEFGDGFVLDGNTLKVTLAGGNCSCEPYVLPTMSESIKGGAKVGHSLLMTDESLNVALDTISSTIEGFMWINDINLSVSGGVATDDQIDDMFDNVFGN